MVLTILVQKLWLTEMRSLARKAVDLESFLLSAARDAAIIVAVSGGVQKCRKTSTDEQRWFEV